MAISVRTRLLLNRFQVAGLLLACLPLALLGATDARACAVCFVAEEETRVAFLVTTGLLSFLPLAFAGGVVWWLVKRSRELRRAEAEEQARYGAVTGVSSSR